MWDPIYILINHLIMRWKVGRAGGMRQKAVDQLEGGSGSLAER